MARASRRFASTLPSTSQTGVALENVKNILVDVPGSDLSDAEWITQRLKQMGYETVIMAKLDAAMYGSPATRVRVWWLASLGEDEDRMGADLLDIPGV